MKNQFFAFLLFFSCAAYGQDLIVTTTGDSLNCKIVDVQTDVIKFRFGSGNPIDIKHTEVSSYEYNFEPVPGPPVPKSKRKVSIGLQAGVNVANIHHEYTNSSYLSDYELLVFLEYYTELYDTDLGAPDDVKLDIVGYKPKAGVTAGVTIDIPLSKIISLQSGLFYSGKGSSYTENHRLIYGSSEIIAKIVTHYKLSYLEIPVVANFQIPFSDLVKLNLNAGPYVGVGIAGTTEGKVTVLSTTSNTDPVKVFTEGGNDDNGALTRLDAGLTVGGGLSFGHFLVGLHYNLGLNNISTFTTNETANTSTFSVRLGYHF